MTHKVTPETRKMVENAAGLGLNFKMIATLLAVNEKTLMRRYRREIDLGKAKAGFNIAKTAYDRAQAGDAQMLKYWLATQLKWQEAPVEITTPPGRPLQHTYVPQQQELLGDYYARLEAARTAPDTDPRPALGVGPAGSEGDQPAVDPDPLAGRQILSPR